MTAPALAALRLLHACALGAALGAVYDFLRPLRPRWTAAADLLFLAAAGWGWLILSFGICGGDLRIAYTAGLVMGGLAWERTMGRLLIPVFSHFWKQIFRFCAFTALPVKKILKNVKILFALAEKWVTIKWSNRRHHRRTTGGTPYGRLKKVYQSDSSGASAQSDRNQDHGDSGARIVYGRTADPSHVHRGTAEGK